MIKLNHNGENMRDVFGITKLREIELECELKKLDHVHDAISNSIQAVWNCEAYSETEKIYMIYVLGSMNSRFGSIVPVTGDILKRIIETMNGDE